MPMRQPPANQLHVLGGVLAGLAFCALPFALPGVRKTEAQARPSHDDVAEVAARGAAPVPLPAH